MNQAPHEPRSRERFYRRSRSSVPAARRFVAEALRDWGVQAERGDDVLLCVSELATNALLHGVPPGRGFQLFLRCDTDDVLRLELHDSGGGMPEIGRAGAHEDGGRGLFLVSRLSDDWGVGERNPGKIVWCVWRLSF
ncbi:ATP-binding protein [Streptomyces sp. NPDC049954]|uniref:ATP-binding protein n=1 Tax=Streptomyces sp. NPDC049954 TaxID=3155779 RepID=UPI003434EEF1